jgi:hypothetical protein
MRVSRCTRWTPPASRPYCECDSSHCVTSPAPMVHPSSLLLLTVPLSLSHIVSRLTIRVPVCRLTAYAMLSTLKTKFGGGPVILHSPPHPHYSTYASLDSAHTFIVLTLLAHPPAPTTHSPTPHHIHTYRIHFRCIPPVQCVLTHERVLDRNRTLLRNVADPMSACASVRLC